jgi:TolB protein
VWSPDGAHLLYFSRRDDGWEVYLADAAGNQARRLPINPAQNLRTITWSPDGRWIAYPAVVDGTSDIVVMAVADGETRNVTQNPAEDDFPAWSPDSRQLLFTSDRSGSADIFWMALDCGAARCPPRNLTQNPALDAMPQWSPDGSEMVFISNRDCGDYDVFTQGLDGSGVQNISRNHLDDTGPQWSPDGQRLLWLSPFNERYDRRIVIGDLSGVQEHSIANQDGNITSAVWSPDMHYLAFAYAAETTRQVYVMDLRDERWRLVGGGLDGHSPAWKP